VTFGHEQLKIMVCIIIRAMKTKCVARGSQWSKINGKVFDVILLYLRTKLEPVDLK
jgi:NADH:ubiquinone oxidoreductase subunit K